MRPVLLALALSLLGAPAAGATVFPASPPTDRQLACYQSASGFFQRGLLRLDTDSAGAPARYRFGEGYLEKKPVGRWTWDGSRVGFASGPLARADKGWSLAGFPAPPGTTMPADQSPGRTWPLVFVSLTSTPAATAPAPEGQEGERSYWYCRATRVNPRATFAGETGWVERRTGLQAKLPTSLEPGQYTSVEGTPYSTVFGRVRVATRRLYRLELLGGPCAKDCPSLAIFSAKRAPASQLGHRIPIRLSGGIRGWVGGVGCGYDPGPDWGPVYCGRSIVVWHARGVNYAIESSSQTDADLVRLANQVVRDPS